MLEIVTFIFNGIIMFFKMLDGVMIPTTNISLFDFYIGIVAISIVMNFVRHFFGIERSMFNTKVDRMYFKRRSQMIQHMNDRKDRILKG
jgi:hypothetical protein